MIQQQRPSGDRVQRLGEFKCARKRELSKLIAELGRLTPLQRRQVSIELNAGDRAATAVVLIEKGVQMTRNVLIATAKQWFATEQQTGCNGLNAGLAPRLSTP